MASFSGSARGVAGNVPGSSRSTSRTAFAHPSPVSAATFAGWNGQASVISPDSGAVASPACAAA